MYSLKHCTLITKLKCTTIPTDHIYLCVTYMGWACILTLLSGTDYSLCWQGINVWKFSHCWGQCISLLPPISPSAEYSCPWANTITEALHWNTPLSHDTRPVTGQITVFLSATIFMVKGVWIMFASESPVLLSKGPMRHSSLISCRPPMLWRKATGPWQGPVKVLPIHWFYLGKDETANETLHLAR